MSTHRITQFIINECRDIFYLENVTHPNCLTGPGTTLNVCRVITTTIIKTLGTLLFLSRIICGIIAECIVAFRNVGRIDLIITWFQVYLAYNQWQTIILDTGNTPAANSAFNNALFWLIFNVGYTIQFVGNRGDLERTAMPGGRVIDRHACNFCYLTGEAAFTGTTMSGTRSVKCTPTASQQVRVVNIVNAGSISAGGVRVNTLAPSIDYTLNSRHCLVNNLDLHIMYLPVTIVLVCLHLIHHWVRTLYFYLIERSSESQPTEVSQRVPLSQPNSIGESEANDNQGTQPTCELQSITIEVTPDPEETDQELCSVTVLN